MIKIDELITQLGTPQKAAAAAAAPAGPPGKQEVILEVDGKRLGKVVYDSYLKDRMQPVIDSG